MIYEYIKILAFVAYLVLLIS